MAEFGMPYMGSKGPLAKWVLQKIPKQENIYDLFGGGFAISHCAVLSKKWNNVHYNEIQKDVTELVKDAIAGKYSYERFRPEWISRHDFFRLKSENAYIRYCWSFGNNGKGYMFGEDVEPIKRSAHQAVVFSKFDDDFKNIFGFDKWLEGMSITHRRLYLKKVIRHNKNLKRVDLQQLQQLERLQQLEQLERLEQLQQLQQLERLERPNLKITSMDCREVEIRKESVIYCDPPYVNTASYYKSGFDHESFYDWVRNNKWPVYISEYSMPDDFKVIASMSKIQKLSPKKENRKSYFETIFANKMGWELYNDTQQGISRPKTKIRKKSAAALIDI